MSATFTLFYDIDPNFDLTPYIEDPTCERFFLEMYLDQLSPEILQERISYIESEIAQGVSLRQEFQTLLNIPERIMLSSRQYTSLAPAQARVDWTLTHLPSNFSIFTQRSVTTQDNARLDSYGFPIIK